MNTEQVYERLVPVIGAIDKAVTCQSFVTNANGTYTMASKTTKWALPGFDVTILNDIYRIVSVIPDVSITVSGPVPPAVLTFDLYAPKFKHGSMISVAAELSAIQAQADRMPLIWLQDITEEKLHLDIMDSVDTDADCRLHFLCPANFQNWTIEDGDQFGIKPMRSLWNEVLKALSKSPAIGELTGVANIRAYNNFGTVNEKGAIRHIFNEPLCGIMSRITIPFDRDCDCCEAGQLDIRPAPGYVLDQAGNILAILYSNEKYTVTPPACAGVDIEDQAGNIIATVPSGGSYQVTVLDKIVDTITANSAVIIDNIT